MKLPKIEGVVENTKLHPVRRKCAVVFFSALLATQILGTILPPRQRPPVVALILNKSWNLFHLAGNLQFFIPRSHEDVMQNFVIETRKTIDEKVNISTLDEDFSYFSSHRLRELDWHSRLQEKMHWIGQLMLRDQLDISNLTLTFYLLEFPPFGENGELRKVNISSIELSRP
jgi:hypothetical protein